MYENVHRYAVRVEKIERQREINVEILVFCSINSKYDILLGIRPTHKTVKFVHYAKGLPSVSSCQSQRLIEILSI